MSHGEDDDDPQLKSLRSVWLSMPDEDPPDRGLDALMAAARVKATEMTTAPRDDEEAAPSWWQRILAGLRRPPVLALASVVVLVAGAVVIGNRQTKLDATAPTGGARPSAEDVSTQGHTTERSYEAPPPPAQPETAPTGLRRDRRESESAIGGAAQEQQLAGPSNGKDSTGGNPISPKSADDVKTVDAEKAPATLDCNAVRAKLQKLAQSDPASYRFSVANDPAVAKCVEPRTGAAEATSATPAE